MAVMKQTVKKPAGVITCPCGKKFKIFPSQMSAKYCSIQCSKKYSSYLNFSFGKSLYDKSR